MNIRPVRTEDDNAAALREIERLWNAPDGTEEADRRDVLAILVEAYESTRWPHEATDPVEVLRFAIDEMGRSQSELAEVLGSRARASQILGRKRALTIEMIDKICRAWGLPRSLLSVPYKLANEAA